MASGKHSKGKHSAPRKGREFSFPRGPRDPDAPERVEMPEEIAKTAAGKMQTAAPGQDDAPQGEARTAEVLDEWVSGQAGDARGPEQAGRARRLPRKRKLAIAGACLGVLLALACVAVLVLARPATTPSQAVDVALSAIKAGDADALARVYDGDADGLFPRMRDALAQAADLGSEMAVERDLNDQQKKTLQEFDGKLTDFDYRIVEVSQDADRASVEVEFTCYDLGGLSQEVLAAYAADGLSAASEGEVESSSDAAKRLVSTLAGKMGELSAKDRTGTATLSLSRGRDGSWKLGGLSQEALSALTGGLLDTTTEMQRQLAGQQDGS